MRTYFVATVVFFTGLNLSGCTTVSLQNQAASQAVAVGSASGVAAGTVARVAPAPQGELLPIENWVTTLVTARAVPKLGDVRDISDTFNFEGRIFAHATLTSQAGTHGGQPLVEVKWFKGDKLMSVQKSQLLVTKSPYYIASSTSGTALGAGPAMVQIFANGKLMASKDFLVNNK